MLVRSGYLSPSRSALRSPEKALVAAAGAAAALVASCCKAGCFDPARTEDPEPRLLLHKNCVRQWPYRQHIGCCQSSRQYCTAARMCRAEVLVQLIPRRKR